jgi:hypothetical protein
VSHATRHTVTVTTASDGSATAYTELVTGAVRLAKYVKTDFADGVDFTITSEQTGQTVWTESDVNVSKVISPRQATHSTAGVAALYAGGGSAVLGDVALAQERIKIVIASGGDTKTGTFIFVVA